MNGGPGSPPDTSQIRSWRWLCDEERGQNSEQPAALSVQTGRGCHRHSISEKLQTSAVEGQPWHIPGLRPSQEASWRTAQCCKNRTVVFLKKTTTKSNSALFYFGFTFTFIQRSSFGTNFPSHLKRSILGAAQFLAGIQQRRGCERFSPCLMQFELSSPLCSARYSRGRLTERTRGS